MDIFKIMNGKPRKLTKADKVAINHAAARCLIQEIQEIEDRAMRLGFPITARGLNQAKNGLGWEISGNLDMAAKAIVGKRAGEESR